VCKEAFRTLERALRDLVAAKKGERKDRRLDFPARKKKGCASRGIFMSSPCGSALRLELWRGASTTAARSSERGWWKCWPMIPSHSLRHEGLKNYGSCEKRGNRPSPAGDGVGRDQ
jgi:hypothetical protein